MITNIKRNLLVGVGLAIAVYAVLGFYADYQSLIGSLEGFRWSLLLPAFGLVCLSYAVRFMRWEFLLRVIDIRLDFAPNLLIFLSGLTMSISPAKLGEVVKSLLMKAYAGVKISRSAPVIVAERLGDVFAVVILGAVGTLAFDAGRGILAVTLLLLIIFVAIVQNRRICTRLLRAAESAPLIGRFAEHLEEFYESSYTLLKLRRLAPTALLSTLAWFLECIAAWLLVRGLGSDADLLLVTFVFAIGTLAGALAMIPGGIGVTEGSMTGLLVANGISGGVAVAATLLIRIVTFWFVILLGLAGLALYSLSYGKSALEDGAGLQRQDT